MWSLLLQRCCGSEAVFVVLSVGTGAPLPRPPTRGRTEQHLRHGCVQSACAPTSEAGPACASSRYIPVWSYLWENIPAVNLTSRLRCWAGSVLARRAAGDHADADASGHHGRGKFPLAAQASCMLVIVREGEGLYIPNGWWHEVFTPDFAVSINTW